MPWTDELGEKLEEYKKLSAAFMDYAKTHSPEQAPAGAFTIAKIMMMEGMHHTCWARMPELLAEALLDLSFKDFEGPGVRELVGQIELVFGPITAAKRRLQEHQLFSRLHRKLIAKDPKRSLIIANIIADHQTLAKQFERWISDTLPQEAESDSKDDEADMRMILREKGLLDYASVALKRIHGEAVQSNLISALELLASQKLLSQKVEDLLSTDPSRALEVAKTVCELAANRLSIDLIAPLFKEYLARPPRHVPNRQKPFTDLIDACQILANKDLLNEATIENLRRNALLLGASRREVAQNIAEARERRTASSSDLAASPDARRSSLVSSGMYGRPAATAVVPMLDGGAPLEQKKSEVRPL